MSSYFGDFDGSFVLYDSSENRYLISNEDDARTRISPNSTYKIYSTLIALDAGIITAKDSAMAWNGEACPFDSWNRDQNLNTAMTNSVNWYFMNLDRQSAWTRSSGSLPPSPMEIWTFQEASPGSGWNPP